jgi:putative flippase GtrA
MRNRLPELLRFGSVGGVAFVVDLGLFNLLCFGPGQLMGGRPLAARAIAVATATVVSWLGNRYWTFAHRRTTERTREFASFALMNLVGMGIALGTLALSHYTLDLTSALADNIANIVGTGLGTIFRYFTYRALVFTAPARASDSVQPAGAASAAPAPLRGGVDAGAAR